MLSNRQAGRIPRAEEAVIMNRNRLSLLAMLAWLVLPAWSQEVNVSGNWSLTVRSEGGEAHPAVALKQDGERLTGTYRGRLSETDLRGTLRGREIRFEVRLRFRDSDVDVAYSGTVEGETMKGTVRFGDAGSGTWSAARPK